jgi:hypothetical protein
MNVAQIRGFFVAGVLALLSPATVLAQAQPPQFFLVCGSQPNQPTVYVSGVMQGPAAAFQGFRNDFNAFLSQRFGYQGIVGCIPANTAVIAQNTLNQRTAALRNQKKNVVDTGWTEPAVVATAPPAARQAMAAMQGGGAPAQSQPQPSTAANSASAGTASSPLASILGAVLANAGGSGAKGGTAGGSATAPGGGGTSGSNQQGTAQPAATATAGSSTSPGAGGAGAQSASQQDAPPLLGSAQAQNTKLLVYGCARQDKQVACLTELVNQNRQNTLMQASGMWKDAFLVDDRGDRHTRSGAFFLNVDGDQRPQLDISYGKSAQFVLMFDDVQAKVQKVSLRSNVGGLDVEDISLVAPDDTATDQAH